MSQTWTHCIKQLSSQLSVGDLHECIMPLHPVHHDRTLKLLAPNRYVLNNVKKNLFSLIEKTVLAQNAGINLVQLEIGGHTSDAVKPAENSVGLENSWNGVAAPRPYAGSAMTQDYTFEKHIEGNSNQLARAVAMQVGTNPGTVQNLNPLFIYGGVGLGKTHLMQAAGHLMLKNNPRAKVLFVRAEAFVSDMVTALKNNAMPRFKRHYRSQKALLVDDIQFLAQKTQSQEEFFNTFNELLEGRRQIIITGDRIPNAINGVDARLISRFGGGLAVGVEPPELETRVAILMKKAQDQRVELPKDVAFFIAHAIRSNVRDLQGALSQVIARSGFAGRPINESLAREALQNLLAYQEKRLTVDNIQRIVAEYFNLKITDLTSQTRIRNIARPRQLAMVFTKEYTNLSLPQIGNRFGGRHHTTVINAQRQVEKLLKTDGKVREDHATLQRLLGV